jgi:hypothetical protein
VNARLISILVVVAGGTASAEPLASLVHERVTGTTGDTAVFSEVGLDGAVAATAGAAWGIARAPARLGLVVWFDATVAAGNLDPEDFRVRIGARGDLVQHGAFHIRATMLSVVRATKNTAFEAESFGTEMRLAPGLSLDRWTLDAEVDVENAELARIAPTDAYRALVYEMATSRWYVDTAATLRLGLAGSVRVGPVELAARGGWARSGSNDFLPAVYAQLGASVRF